MRCMDSDKIDQLFEQYNNGVDVVHGWLRSHENVCQVAQFSYSFL